LLIHQKKKKKPLKGWALDFLMLIKIKSKWIYSNMMKLADGGGIDGKMKKKPCNRGDALSGGEEIKRQLLWFVAEKRANRLNTC